MADVRTVASEPALQIRVSAGAERPGIKPAGEKEKAAKEQELENLVSKSEDGDTLQVSEQGVSRLESEMEKKELKTELTEEEKEEKQAKGQPAPETRVERAADSLEQKLAVIGSAGSGKEDQVRQEADRLKVEMAAAGQDNTGAGREIRLEQQAQKMEEDAKEIAAMKAEIAGRLNADQREAAVDEKPERGTGSGQEEKRVDINVSSYTGISNSQLKQMYQKGEISKNDYDKEMEKREEQLESMQQEDEEASKEMAGNVSAGNRVELDAQELKAAFSEDSSQTLDARQRVDIVDTLIGMGVPTKA